MGTAASEGSSPVEVPQAQLVAKYFVSYYYSLLHKSPERLFRFYKDGSMADWPLTSETTLKGINDMIMSSDYKGCSAEIIDVRAQDSRKGIVVAVKGFFEKERVRRSFYQWFFLAPQETGYFVLNDILFVDGDSNENVTSTPISSDPEPADVPTQSKPAGTSTCPQAMGNAKTASNVTDTAAEITTTTTKQSIDNAETVSNATGPAAEVTAKQSIDNAETVVSNATDTAPEVTKQSIENAGVTKQSNTPSQNVKHERPKISYASVVAKESKRASPADNSGYKIVRVAPTANQQSSASSPSKSKSMTQEQPPPIFSSIEIKNTNNDNSVCGEAVISKSIHVQNLPPDVTKNELADAVKKFGRIRQGGVQLKIYEDGFCYGFVDFNSPDSAKAAVEAQNVTLRGYVARISYKKSPNRAGNGTTRASGGNFKGQENGEYEDGNEAVDVGWARGRGFNGQNGESVSRSSRDGRAHNSQGRNERGKSEDANQRNDRRNKRADGESGSK
ncbi:nuclear transport factor 2-like isoform X1 [Coffea arabica]|uniref:Nuclear transport factor 2-like isoform X1 n=2 Tax=Coffea arabica TaxID=13443 RepID=A0A6P6V6B8_COFAR|nr:putative G3BP-like protein [Coffea arabica]